MSVETQASISEWADQVFGPVASNLRVAVRANEEMAELLRALSMDPGHPRVAEEAADVAIVLCRLAQRMGVDCLDMQYPTEAQTRDHKIYAAQANTYLAEVLESAAIAGHPVVTISAIRDSIWNLAYVCIALGKDLRTEMDRKMQINRARKWKLDGSGHGYHVSSEKEEGK